MRYDNKSIVIESYNMWTKMLTIWQYEKWIFWLDKAISLEPFNAKLYLPKLICLFNLNRYDDVLNVFSIIIKLWWLKENEEIILFNYFLSQLFEIKWEEYCKKYIDNNTLNNPNLSIPSYLYRISRLENLTSIIDLWILSRNLSKKYLNFENNSYDHIQDRRSQFWKYNLHDYAPLFFSKYPAMIYSTKIRENINNQIVILFDWNLINDDWVAFSDVSLAYSDIAEDNLFDDLDLLKNLDFSLFEKKWWENDISIRKKKWAEVLVKKRIDFKYAREIIYFDKSKKEIIENILKEKWYNIPITYNNYEDYKW